MGWLDTGMRWLVYAAATFMGFVGLAIGMGILGEANAIGILYFFIGWFPVIVVHELGHAVAAELVGWRVWIFHAAPFAVRLRPFAAYIVGRMEGPDTGGFVFSLPRSVEADTWRRRAWFAAGGPIASWLFAALCFAYAWRPQSGADVIDHLAAATGCYSVAAALLTTWPTRNGRLNDAATIIDLLRTRTAADTSLSGIWQARHLWAFGVPQRAIEPWMRQASNSPLTDQHAEFVLFTDILDAIARDDETAVRAQTTALSNRSPNSPEAVVAQGFVAVWYDADISRADDFLAHAPSLEDDDVMCVRQLALLTIFRLTDDIEAAERTADSVRYHAWHRWRFHGSTMDLLATRAMTRRLPTRAPIQPAGLFLHRHLP
jgi:hypothetical protein